MQLGTSLLWYFWHRCFTTPALTDLGAWWYQCRRRSGVFWTGSYSYDLG